MAITAKMYGNAMKTLLNGEWNWTNSTIKVMLCTNTYVPDQDAHIYKSSVTGEVVGTGYTAGGATVASKAILAYDSTNNLIAVDAADTSWASSTITARYAVVYADTGTAGTSSLIGYIDFGADMTSSAGAFTIQWNASGIFSVSAA